MAWVTYARRVAGLTAIWVVVGLVSGGQLYFTTSPRGADGSLGVMMGFQVLNALPWIPVTALILRVVRAAPITGPTWSRRLPAYVVGAVAIVWLVNIAQVSLTAIAESGLRSPGFWGTVMIGTLQWGHLALVVVGALVAIAHAMYRRASPAVSTDDHRPAAQSAPRTPAHVDTLRARVGRATRVIRTESIDWIEAAGDYVRAHVAGDAYLLQNRMAELERTLDPRRFARIHRSAIVNLSRVREYIPASHGDYELVLENGRRLRLSRSRREALDRLKNLVSV